MTNPNTLVLDTAAVRRNYKKLTECFGKRAICVVKANAYGHGADAVVKALYAAGARYFAVANIVEAVYLRKRVLKDCCGTEMFVLGYVDKKDLSYAEKYDITVPVISEQSFSEIINSRRKLKCYLQIDTGMNRLGVDHLEKRTIACVLNALKNSPNIDVLGVGSHFYDGESDVTVALQTKRFSSCFDGDYNISLSASGALDKQTVDGEYKRLGLCLYGYGGIAERLGLEKPLSLYSVIIRIKHIKKGETVGYNAVFTAKKDTIIGTIPLGYADGIIRAYRGAHVYVNGKKCLISAVCMDMTMIELPDDVGLYDKVTVFSNEGNLEALTKNAGMIVYEGFTALGGRQKRIII